MTYTIERDWTDDLTDEQIEKLATNTTVLAECETWMQEVIQVIDRKDVQFRASGGWVTIDSEPFSRQPRLTYRTAISTRPTFIVEVGGPRLKVRFERTGATLTMQVLEQDEALRRTGVIREVHSTKGSYRIISSEAPQIEVCHSNVTLYIRGTEEQSDVRVAPVTFFTPFKAIAFLEVIFPMIEAISAETPMESAEELKEEDYLVWCEVDPINGRYLFSIPDDHPAFCGPCYSIDLAPRYVGYVRTEYKPIPGTICQRPTYVVFDRRSWEK